ncbi:MAG: MurNAc alpha-1-phosphate uridylyltransferase [Paracoccaceae bacterium]|jgi:MurNAc alpha-1-phosphate uridylyltransferase
MTAPDIAPATAMILSAGRGTRMGALTDTCPKPMLPVAGRPLIDHAMARAAEGGARRFVVNLHHLGAQIRAHLAGRADVSFSDEPELLETGGGLVRALPLLGDAPFYAVNSDAVWTGPPPLAPLAAAWDPARMDALLLMVARTDALAYTRAGDFLIGEDMRPTRRGDRATAPYIYTGAQILAPDAVRGFAQTPFSANLIWDRALAAGRLFAAVHHGAWIDVGTPDGLAVASAALQRTAP